ncbi:ZIP family metal transporter [Pseudomonas sp. ML96]|uniref:ZIP family metal transporter n=1 Tax=Pseudomonadaceae TaxID=135621 RepID=UPI0005BD50DB|nr:integral membrane protein [Pseudomonas sp. ML96]
MALNMTLQAGLWGWLAASSLLLGAAIGVFVRLPRKAVASIMAYGSGVLIAAICFEQLPDALRLGGHVPSLAGMFCGGLAFVLASRWLERLQGGQGAMAGLLIAAGAFLDGIPESLGLGLGLLDGGSVSLVMLVAIFLSNLPEGLASAAGLRDEGRSRAWVFGLWGVIVLLSGLAAMAGPALFAGLPDTWLAFVLGFSAGAVLCMLVDSMIPEAFAETHALTGLITLSGFMTALALDKVI